MELGTPVIMGNLLILPVLGDSVDLKIITLDEGYNSGVTVEEIDEINKVVINNDSGDMLFIMDGEEFIGARQDRVAVCSSVIDREKSIEYPVVCIEKGRWEGDERFFSTGFSAFPELRKTLTFSSDDYLKVDQNKVWSSVERKLLSLNVSSKTMSLHSSFEDKAEDISEYTMWEPEEDCLGVLAFSNRGFLCCDIFASHEMFKKLKDKVLAGYALDAMEDRIRGRKFSISIDKAVKVWKHIEKARVVRNRKSVDLGVEEILESSGIKGKRLRFMDSYIHTTFFPK